METNVSERAHYKRQDDREYSAPTTVFPFEAGKRPTSLSHYEFEAERAAVQSEPLYAKRRLVDTGTGYPSGHFVSHLPKVHRRRDDPLVKFPLRGSSLVRGPPKQCR